jgi:transposase
MLTWETTVEAQAPFGQGWTISAIARHLGINRRTVRTQLVGALAHSSRWRAVLAESEDQPQLVAALDAVTRRLGGLTRRWRFDRMATVCAPGSGRLSASFAAVAMHYGVGVDICPVRHGNRKGVVEKGNHSLAQRWWPGWSRPRPWWPTGATPTRCRPGWPEPR